MANALRRAFETDNNLETKGIVLDYGEGVEITVARAGGANKKFTKALARLTKPHRVAIRNETMHEDASSRLLHTAYAETVVLGWKGVTKDIITQDDADATQELAFTKDNIIAVFKALPDLFADVATMSQNISLYRNEQLELDAGN